MEIIYDIQELDALALFTLFVCLLALAVFYFFCWWRIYTKAGKPGWAIFIPIYNILVLLEIVQRPWWWLLLTLFVPFAKIVLCLAVIFDLAKVFGKDNLFGTGLFLLAPIFFPILALDDAKYVGRFPPDQAT